MKRGAVPDPPLVAENLQQSEHTKVYISFRIAPEATSQRACGFPIRGKKAFLSRQRTYPVVVQFEIDGSCDATRTA
jgi:hypothetical protein